MDAKTFHNELKAIVDETNDKIVELVQRAQAEEGMNWDTDKPLSFYQDPNWNYPADGLAELCGWIYDRVSGINRLHRKSITKRIRKALGYTHP